MNNLYTFLIIFLLCFSSTSSEITGKEFQAIKKSIKKGEKLTNDQMEQFNIIVNKIELDKYYTGAFKQIRQKGLIYRAISNREKIEVYRENVAKEFGNIKYKREQPITNILNKLISDLKKLEADDIIAPDLEEWETATQTTAKKLISEAKEEIIEFFGRQHSFSYLKNEDAIEALRLALTYGINDLVDYFITNKEDGLTQSQFDSYLENITQFEDDSLTDSFLDLAWFNTGEGCNFDECRKIITNFYQLQELRK